MAELQPVQFQAPPVNPAAPNLYAVINWQQDGGDGPLRFLTGVDVEPFNYGAAAGVWGAAWCASEDDLAVDDVKDINDRPDFPDTYTAGTFFGYDECTPRDMSEIRDRAAQNQRVLEPSSVEDMVATRLLADVPVLDRIAAVTVVAAVGVLEAAIAQTGIPGFIHAAPQWAAPAAEANLISRQGALLRTPLGNTWVFGGGYVDTLTDTLVATSQPYGWRGPQNVHPALKMEHNRYVTVAERSVLVAWEATIAAATIGAE